MHLDYITYHLQIFINNFGLLDDTHHDLNVAKLLNMNI